MSVKHSPPATAFGEPQCHPISLSAQVGAQTGAWPQLMCPTSSSTKDGTPALQWLCANTQTGAQTGTYTQHMLPVPTASQSKRADDLGTFASRCLSRRGLPRNDGESPRPDVPSGRQSNKVYPQVLTFNQWKSQVQSQCSMHTLKAKNRPNCQKTHLSQKQP